MKIVNAPGPGNGVVVVSGLVDGRIATNLVATGIVSELKQEVVSTVYLREKVSRGVLGKGGEL